MAELKTQRNDADVGEFLDGVEHDGRREDAIELLGMLREVTGEEPAMWGDSIVGFGSYDYRYPTGRTGTWFRLGFSPRKRDLTVYLMDGVDAHDAELGRLGPHRLGKSCLYLGRLSSVDGAVLRRILTDAWEAEAMGETGD